MLARDSTHAARAARLHFVLDDRPGFSRRRAGRGFVYFDARGRRLTDPAHLARIRALAIPPAWTDVWIAPSPVAHVQATGRDARGRKQYRYHPRWRAVRDETKFARMIAFADALPQLRARTARDLSLPGLPRTKVVAAIVTLLEKTLIRVGNDQYAEENGSFGLTTLRDGHVAIDGTQVRFRYVGKSGVSHEVQLTDRRLAAIVKRCRDLPGQALFQYLDEHGRRQRIGSTDVNRYIRDVTGQHFTAKDFRTWAGTVLAFRALRVTSAARTEAHRKRNVVGAIAAVASRLGNTAAVCRRCYIHPAVLDAYMRGAIAAAETIDAPLIMERAPDGSLTDEELAVVTLVRKALSQPAAA